MNRIPPRVTAATPPEEWPYLLRKDEVAILLGVSVDSVERAIKRGTLPARRYHCAGAGTRAVWRVKRDDLANPPPAWMGRNR